MKNQYQRLVAATGRWRRILITVIGIAAVQSAFTPMASAQTWESLGGSYVIK